MNRLPLSRTGKQAIDVAAAAAVEAGAILMDHFREETRVRFKSRANIVTDVDLRADRRLKSVISAEFPDHSFISEETEPLQGDSSYTWILDPLDGTNNYSFGIPFFCTVIALTRGEEVLAGVVYDPLRDELFAAERDRGTMLNGVPVSVSKKTSVQDSLAGFDLGYVEEQGGKLLGFIHRLWPGFYACRIMGSAALGMAYVACGRIDLYVHAVLYPWELACGRVLVEEAGGKATDWSGRPVGTRNSSIIVSNSSVHAEFMQTLQRLMSA
ncbi:MAG: inositol monophosphatase [Dehalococcoidia bacterium]|nr:inositol monophosphatase [Dehalococcoidia bacterium]